jgi:hypothetical protein
MVAAYPASALSPFTLSAEKPGRRLFDVAETKRWKCSAPTEAKVDAGNFMLVVFSLE